MLDEPGPPFSQIIHGAVELLFVRLPFVFSKAQKKSVAFGWSARLTPTFPAKLRALGGAVTFGNGSVTRKYFCHSGPKPVFGMPGYACGNVLGGPVCCALA